MSFLFLVVAVLAFQEPNQDLSIGEKLSQQLVPEYSVHLHGLLSNQQLCKELEILPSQVDEIRDKLTMTLDKIMEDSGLLKGSKPLESEDTESRNKRINKHNARMIDAMRDAFSDVLLPHQIKEVDRLIFWSMIRTERMRAQGTAFTRRSESRSPFQSVLKSQVVVDLLELDEAQAKKLEDRSQQLQEEFAKELAELQEKYEGKMRSELTDEQRKDFKRIFGDVPALVFQ